MTKIATCKTNLGTFKVELYTEQLPITTGNFIDLANKGFYDGIVSVEWGILPTSCPSLVKRGTCVGHSPAGRLVECDVHLMTATKSRCKPLFRSLAIDSFSRFLCNSSCTALSPCDSAIHVSIWLPSCQGPQLISRRHGRTRTWFYFHIGRRNTLLQAQC